MEVVKVEELEEGLGAMTIVEEQSLNRKVYGNMELDVHGKLWIACGRSEHKIVKLSANFMTKQPEENLKFEDMKEAHGLCFLHDGKIAVTDYQKSKIFILDQNSLEMSTNIPLTIGSSGICRVNDKFLAANLKDGSTVILNYSLLSVVQILKTTHQSHSFNGVCYTKGKLLIGDWKNDRISCYGLQWNADTKEFDHQNPSIIELRSPLFMGVCPRSGDVYVPCKKIKQIWKLIWHDESWIKEKVQIGSNEQLDYDPMSVAIHSDNIYVAFDRSLVTKYRLTK